MINCKYCDRKAKSVNSNTQHEIRCKENPNKIKTTGSGGRLPGFKGANQFTKAKLLGLPKPVVSEETRKKLSKSGIEQNKNCWTPEKRKQHSESMKRAVRNNPDSYSKNNVSGRVKLIEYNGSKLKGSWELLTAQWLDRLNVKWETEVNPQEYCWNNGTHLYFPDFYLPDYNIYIEVKGYKRERDIAKWSAFTGTLTIINLDVIHKLEQFNNIEEFIKHRAFSTIG